MTIIKSSNDERVNQFMAMIDYITDNFDKILFGSSEGVTVSMNNNKISIPIGLLIRAWVVEYCKFHKHPYDLKDDWFKQLESMTHVVENKEKELLVQKYILDYCISHHIKYYHRSPVILRLKDTFEAINLKSIKVSPQAEWDYQLDKIMAKAHCAACGVNELMLGSDIAPGTSGRAIELRQKIAINDMRKILEQ